MDHYSHENGKVVFHKQDRRLYAILIKFPDGNWYMEDGPYFNSLDPLMRSGFSNHHGEACIVEIGKRGLSEKLTIIVERQWRCGAWQIPDPQFYECPDFSSCEFVGDILNA